MSFHRARKGIRVLTLVGVVVVAGLTLTSYLALKKRRANTLPMPAKMAEGVDQQTQAFSLSKSLGGQRIYTITASQVTNYKETGKTLLRDAVIQLFGKNGTRQDKITAKECEFDPAAGTMFIPGDVEMDLQSPDAVPGVDANIPAIGPVHIRTSGLSFNQNTGVASTDNDVHFRFKSGEGSSVGAVYNPGDRTITMISKARFDLQQPPSADSSGENQSQRTASVVAAVTHIAAGSLRFDSTASKIFLTAPVEIVQGTRLIDAGDSEIQLNEEQRATGATLHGGIRAVDRDPQMLSDIQASAANVDLSPEGRISRMELISTDSAPNANSERTLVRWATASGQSIKAGESANVEMLFDGVTNRMTNVNVHGKVRFSMGYLTTPASLPLLATRSVGNAVPNEARILITEQAAMTLSPDGSSIKDLKTQGPSAIEIFPTKPSEDKRTVRAEKFLFAFGADGELNDFTAEGKVTVVAEGMGKQARTRTSTSDNLWASFDRQTHNVSRMRQWGLFSYQDSDRKARSDKAEYDAGHDSIVLDNNVRIWNSDGTVTAKNAVLNATSGDMKAEGEVSTNYVSQNSHGATTQAPVNVSSDRLDYSTKTQKASYQGRSRLWQGTNMIQADTIEVDRRASRLTAQKNVYSIFGVPKENAPKQTPVKNPAVAVTGDNSGPVEVRAEELLYDDETNRAIYRHNVRMKNSTASLTCEELELLFKPRPGNASQADLQIDRAIATQNVHIVQPTRQATAERAEYVPDEKKITLIGNLAAISDSEKGSTQGIRLTYFTGDDRILVDGKPGTQAETKRAVRP